MQVRRFGRETYRALLLATVTATAVLSSTARADITDIDNDSLPQIIVTAQRQETNLQKTPISISVLSSDDLTNRHTVSLESLGDGSIPSLRVAPFFARSSALTVGMRGIGSLGDANQPARDQAVGVYIDGVYLGRAQGLGSALFDLERIEVLKGPQGTLFGRNTEGGAISIVTRAPSGEFHTRFTAGYGNYNAHEAAAHIDLPSYGNFALKLDGLLSKRNGTVKNPTNSGQPDFNSYDKRGASLRLRWSPTDTFTADYGFDVSYDGTTPYFVQLESKGSLALAPLLSLQPTRTESAIVGVPMQTSLGQTRGHRLTLDWQAMPGLDIKSISSYRKLSQGQFDNAETFLSAYAPNGNFSRYSIARVHQSQYSEELHAVGAYDSFNFVVGGFYYHEKADDNAQTPNTMQWNATGTGYTTLSVDLNRVIYDRASRVQTESYGVFGQGTYTPPMMNGIAHLTAGGRYTHDAKEGFLDQVNGAVPSYVNSSGVTVVGIIPLNASWSRFDPMVNLSVDVAPDVSVYGKWSTGYKAGGANSRSLTYRPFNPETVSMFEAGVKSEFLDKRARLNVAAFTGNLKNAQVDFNVIIVGNNRGTLETTNAATGKTKGGEVEFTVVPVNGLTLSANYTYTDVTLSKAFNPFINAQSTIYPLYAPKHAGSIAADYETPMLGATLAAHVDANFAGRQFTSSTDPTLSDSSSIVNARLALTDISVSDSGAKVEFALWSRNLLNEQHVFLRNFNASLGTYVIFNEPRTFGFNATVKF